VHRPLGHRGEPGGGGTESQSGDSHSPARQSSAPRCACRVASAATSVTVATHSVTAASVGLRFLPACLHSVLRSHRLRLLARRTQGKAEARVAVAVRRVAPVAARRTAEPGGVAPAAAPEHPVRARCWATRVTERRRGIVVRTIPIFAPLPNVAMHVMQTKFVCLESANRRCVDESVSKRKWLIHFRGLALVARVQHIAKTP